MKTIITIIFLAVLALGGYCIYLGLTDGEHNNAGMIALDASNLAQSVTDTFKDGTTVLVKKSKEAATEAKEKVAEGVSSAAETVKDKAGEVVDSAKVKAAGVVESAKEDVADAISGVIK